MELEEAIKKLKTLNQERYNQDTILSLYNNFIDEDEENQPYVLTPFERDAIETVLNHLAKQEKMIDLMLEELAFGVFDFKSIEQAKQYFEKKAEEAE